MKINKCPICGMEMVMRSYFCNYFEYEVDETGKLSDIFTLPEDRVEIMYQLHCKRCNKSCCCDLDSNHKKVVYATFMGKKNK